MTDAPRSTSPELSSNPILKATLLWGLIVGGVLAAGGGVIGFLVAAESGMWSALAGVLLGVVFLAITALSILIANRWYGDPLYVPIFFGIVLGGWILKLVIFIVLMMVLRGQPWLHPTIFFVAVVVGVLAALLIDVVTMLRMRQPYVSDITLPGEEASDGKQGATDGTPDAGGSPANS